MAAPASTAEHVASVPQQNKDKVYIGNLGYESTEEGVRGFVASAGGNVTSVVIPLRFGKRPSGFALVTYDKEEDAASAVEKLQDKELDGRKLRVQLARPDEEVAELNAKRREEREAKRAAEKEAKKEAKKAAAAEKAAAGQEGGEAAAPAEGEAAKPKKKSTKSRTSRRRVPGEDGEDTEDAAATDAVEGADQTGAAKPKSKRKPKAKKPTAAASEARIDGGEATETGAEAKPVREKKERQPREKKLAPSGEDSKKLMQKDTLFVSNLPYDIDDDALASIFTNLSIEIKSAKVIRSTFNRYRGKKPASELKAPVPRSRGFGFVEVANPAQRDEAVEKASGTLIASREIGVKVAKEMQRINGEEGEEKPTVDVSQIQGTPEKA